MSFICNTLSLFIRLISLLVCLCGCMHVCGCLRPDESVEFPIDKVIGSCEQPNVGARNFNS